MRRDTILISDKKSKMRKTGIKINDFSFQYDVYTLTKAFFPEDDLSVFEKSDSVKINDKYDILIDIVVTKNIVDIRLSDENQKVFIRKSDECSGCDRKETKNALKRTLYHCLSAFLGRTLPWGTLSGIRPVKIPFKMLLSGKTTDEITSYMKENYLVSDEKCAQALVIAKTERKALDEIGSLSQYPTDEYIRNGYSLYIGIPFCPSICFYCTFASGLIGDFKDRIDEYVDTLIYELKKTSEMMADRKLFTVYIGGGTPTVLTPVQMERLMTAVEKYFPVKDVLEYTVEAGRPDTINREILQVIKKHGATRISINPQTMNDRTLEIIGRRHNSEQITEAFRLAREIGFDNINMDIIAGLPSEGKTEIENTLKKIAELGPESLTVHSLAVKRASKLNMNFEDYSNYTYVNNDEIMAMASDSAEAMGLIPYYLYRQKNMKGNLENIGFAKPEKIGLYNILIMEERQSVMAVGAGAISKVIFGDDCKAVRAANVKNINEYLSRIDEMVARKGEILHCLK